MSLEKMTPDQVGEQVELALKLGDQDTLSATIEEAARRTGMPTRPSGKPQKK